jgi:hypothetical protein
MDFCHIRIAEALQTSLSMWVSFHDLLISMTMSGELDDLHGSQVESQAGKFLTFERYAATTRPHSLSDAEQLIDGAVERSNLRGWLLRDVPESNDHDLLSWATEYLSANIFAYNAPLRCHGRWIWTARRSTWATTDGCMPTVESRCMCLDQAASGLVTSLYIPASMGLGYAICREEAFDYVGRCPVPLNGILALQSQRHLPNLDNVEMKQITHLCVALDEKYVSRLAGELPVYLGSHDLWSSNLLRRYIAASSPWSLVDLQHATVDDLRQVVKIVLLVMIAGPKEMENCGITQASVVVYAAPPADFDSDLFRPLAWRYGPILDRAWREYVATASSTTMDLG